MLQPRGQRGLVQAHFGVGEVVVVEDEDVCAARPDELGNRRDLAVHIQLHAAGALQALTPVLAGHCVGADHHTVRAQGGRGPLGDLLADGRGGDDAVAVGLDRHAQGGHARLLKPHAGPGLQVAPRDLLQLGEQIGQCGIAVGVGGQVALDSLEEALPAHVAHESRQDGGPLGVGDAVEVHLDVVQVVDLGRDRVGRGELILVVGPALLEDLEGGPGVCEARGLGDGERGDVLGEGLVEPQVVPPLHRHHVPEPHVGQLVEDGDGAALHARLDGPGAEDVVVAVGDAPGVLHGARIELGHEDLVVLREGVGGAEELLVVGEAVAGHLQDLVGVHVLGQRGAAVDAQRDDSAVGRPVLVGRAPVGAGDDRGDVGADWLGGGEGEGAGPVLMGRRGRGGVRQDGPVLGHGHREGEGGLEVRLLEDGEDPTGVGHLELGVEIGLGVGRVGEPVQPLPGVHVGAVGDHRQLVVGHQIGQDDTGVDIGLGGVQLAAVQNDGVHPRGDQVDEGNRIGTG